MHEHRIDRQHAQLLVVDVQERLLPSIAHHQAVIGNALKMIRAAVALEVPVTLSEQYPKGLGSTAAVLVTAAHGAARAEKSTFSFCADAECRERLVAVMRPHILILGIEAHVCVYQTALDILAMQMRPVVLADAVGSRRMRDCEVALAGLRAAGVVVTTVESAIFQLVHDSATDAFKRILPIVK